MSELDKILRGGDNNYSQVIEPKDISQIIKTAYIHGVDCLEFGDLKISFLKRDQQLTAPEVSSLRPELTNSSTRTRKASEKQMAMQANEEQGSLLAETIALRQQQVDQLLVNEPEKFEELLAQGELEPDVQDEDAFGT